MDSISAVLAVMVKELFSTLLRPSFYGHLTKTRKGKSRRTTSIEVAVPGIFQVKRSVSEISEWDDSEHN
ncbi:hypothetical protein [Henriciella mobilis]|uniref:Uncharacterized protein n=1 Tax=Henriciella mobilis TaxID=2305467 RepID=A0A399R6J0_9PROT|nr:hypothetical protein [Henriciella mobilis]RIJ26383.1 hypothetical protein D1223_15455 [Henriciella mobilis]